MKNLIRCRQCGREFAAEVVDGGFEGVCPKCLAAFAMETGSGDVEVGEPLTVGARFRSFEILERLGAGGMGVVYKARQAELGRTVALKVLSPALARDPEFAARFGREAKALASLNHPSIVQVYEYGKEDELYYLAMEYVDGVSLRAVLAERSLAPADALRIVPQICDALEFAHAHGVVHRDIKPENILLDTRGRVKIADFGLAKMRQAEERTLTRTSMAMGTPQYMAPEQFERMKDVDHRADIYSLGVVFYEMLTGEIPAGHFLPPSRKVAMDARLDEVVLKAMAKEPERRYQRAGEVKTDVETLSSRPPRGPAEGPAATAARTSRMAVWSFAGALIGLGLMILGVAIAAVMA